MKKFYILYKLLSVIILCSSLANEKLVKIRGIIAYWITDSQFLNMSASVKTCEIEEGVTAHLINIVHDGKFSQPNGLFMIKIIDSNKYEWFGSFKSLQILVCKNNLKNSKEIDMSNSTNIRLSDKFLYNIFSEKFAENDCSNLSLSKRSDISVNECYSFIQSQTIDSYNIELTNIKIVNTQLDQIKNIISK